MKDLLRRLTGKMTDEERARLVSAIDHDARQLQHSTEMGLRTLRLITTDLSARRFDEASFDPLLRGMTVELASVQVAIRQVMAAQQDLVDAIRLEFGHTKPMVRAIRADELIERACKSNRGLAGNVDVRRAASRLTLLSDERWVQRILNNLIANAVWHSDGTKIFVGARRRGDDIVFEVRDNGSGIAPVDQARLFERFYRGAQQGARQQRGSGLGLAIVKSIAERHGGRVWAESQLGKGSAFYLELPILSARRGKAG